MSDQIFLFLVPSMATEIPFGQLLDSLLISASSDGSYKSQVPNVSHQNRQSLRVQCTPWLLYALLTIGKEKIGIMLLLFRIIFRAAKKYFPLWEMGKNCLRDESIVYNSLYTIYNRYAALSAEKVH